MVVFNIRRESHSFHLFVYRFAYIPFFSDSALVQILLHLDQKYYFIYCTFCQKDNRLDGIFSDGIARSYKKTEKTVITQYANDKLIRAQLFQFDVAKRRQHKTTNKIVDWCTKEVKGRNQPGWTKTSKSTPTQFQEKKKSNT